MDYSSKEEESPRSSRVTHFHQYEHQMEKHSVNSVQSNRAPGADSCPASANSSSPASMSRKTKFSASKSNPIVAADAPRVSACEVCRKQHKRCDGQLPCARCIRVGGESSCFFKPVQKIVPDFIDLSETMAHKSKNESVDKRRAGSKPAAAPSSDSEASTPQQPFVGNGSNSAVNPGIPSFPFPFPSPPARQDDPASSFAAFSVSSNSNPGRPSSAPSIFLPPQIPPIPTYSGPQNVWNKSMMDFFLSAMAAARLQPSPSPLLPAAMMPQFPFFPFPFPMPPTMESNSPHSELGHPSYQAAVAATMSAAMASFSQNQNSSYHRKHLPQQQPAPAFPFPFPTPFTFTPPSFGASAHGNRLAHQGFASSRPSSLNPEPDVDSGYPLMPEYHSHSHHRSPQRHKLSHSALFHHSVNRDGGGEVEGDFAEDHNFDLTQADKPLNQNIYNSHNNFVDDFLLLSPTQAASYQEGSPSIPQYHSLLSSIQMIQSSAAEQDAASSSPSPSKHVSSTANPPPSSASSVFLPPQQLLPDRSMFTLPPNNGPPQPSSLSSLRKRGSIDGILQDGPILMSLEAHHNTPSSLSSNPSLPAKNRSSSASSLNHRFISPLFSSFVPSLGDDDNDIRSEQDHQTPDSSRSSRKRARHFSASSEFE